MFLEASRNLKESTERAPHPRVGLPMSLWGTSPCPPPPRWALPFPLSLDSAPETPTWPGALGEGPERGVQGAVRPECGCWTEHICPDGLSDLDRMSQSHTSDGEWGPQGKAQGLTYAPPSAPGTSRPPSMAGPPTTLPATTWSIVSGRETMANNLGKGPASQDPGQHPR